MSRRCLRSMICVVCGLVMFSAFDAAAEAGDVRAKVNGKEILQQDVDRIITDFVLPQYQAQNPDAELPEEQRVQTEKSIVEQLVTEQLLLLKAEEIGITADEALVNERFEQVKSQRPELSEETLKNMIKKDSIIQQLLDREVISKVSVTDDEVQAYYEENKDRFQEPEQIQASHILIQLAQDASDEDKEAARKKIEEILVLARDGKDFAELAKEHSEGPSKDRGGDLGFFPKGAMVKPFEDAAFALKENEISDVVETKFGYHIIKVTGKKEAREIPFVEVKDKLKQGLQQQKTSAEVNAWINALRAEASIEIM
ncbi:peptidylprolyl isomerase [candidate division KSB3 bacterium]|uniref:Peptidylprolyl isomerase n=1 Tax=candidate division KSB3 bacterium TaxID=2044937 RepID=A0A2G6E312_9BACT|nr:MAG: peptidylprolyl isomerase [candidate division KSB3 bacterium]PIE28947.1 MAG: peptidylprolyl isomerase [candidate division KSB3 bacterium]